MLTFSRDYSLPALPVPALDDTCHHLKKMIKPLIGNEAFKEASIALDALAADQGVPLQESLLRLAYTDAFNASWLAPIWDDVYLSFRDMLPINMNYAFSFAEKWWGEDELAVLVSALSQTIGKMRTETLPVEFNRDGYLSMFSSAHSVYTRIPNKVRDFRYIMPLSGQMAASVVCKNQWFILSLVDKEGNYLAADAISRSLANIRKRAETGSSASIAGAMTCTDRESAAHLRNLLMAHPRNRMNLDRIEKSVFTICLDEPLGDGEDFGLRLLAGNPGNRWFDKSVQIISDGSHLGANFEHSGCDAGVWVYLLNQAGIMRSAAITPSEGDAHILPLSWNITGALADELEAHADKYRAEIGKLSCCRRRIEDVSRTKIKEFNCSPDAFVQLLYQAAFYKLAGRFVSVYEAVSTRSFYQGRTDCARPVSEETAGFIRDLWQESNTEVLAEKFHSAARVIGENMKRSQNALGPERHMAGLSMMAQFQGAPLPDIFATEGYKTLRHDTISTSNTTANFIDFFTFGPVVSDGLGVGYGIKDDALHVSVAAYDACTAASGQFLDEIELAAKRFYEILKR